MQLIKKRTIKIDSMSCAGCETKITDDVLRLRGVVSVSVDYKAFKIYVSYDLLRINLKDIEEKLNELGYSASKGFIYKVRDGFVHFSEENERDNISAKPAACCSNPTEILAKAVKT